MSLPINTDGGVARVVMCHVDSHTCGTVVFNSDGTVTVGSTQRPGVTIVMTERELVTAIDTRTATPALAALLDADELEAVYDTGHAALATARSLAGLPILAGTQASPVSA